MTSITAFLSLDSLARIARVQQQTGAPEGSISTRP